MGCSRDPVQERQLRSHIQELAFREFPGAGAGLQRCHSVISSRISQCTQNWRKLGQPSFSMISLLVLIGLVKIVIFHQPLCFLLGEEDCCRQIYLAIEKLRWKAGSVHPEAEGRGCSCSRLSKHAQLQGHSLQAWTFVLEREELAETPGRPRCLAAP